MKFAVILTSLFVIFNFSGMRAVAFNNMIIKNQADLRAYNLYKEIYKHNNFEGLLDDLQLQRNKKLKVLLPTREFFIPGVITARTGGLGTVMIDLFNNMPHNPALKMVHFAVMNYENFIQRVPQEQVKRKEVLIFKMGRIKERVEVFQFVPSGTQRVAFMVFSHPLFDNLVVSSSSGDNIYSNPKMPFAPKEAPRWYFKHPEWLDGYRHALFGKAVAITYLGDRYDLLHLNDHHTAFAGIYAFQYNKRSKVLMTIHNAGEAYQGVIYTQGFRGEHNFERDFSNPIYPFGVPGKYASRSSKKALNKLLRMLNVPGENKKARFHNFIKEGWERKGLINPLQKVALDLKEYTGLTPISVSEGEAERIRLEATNPYGEYPFVFQSTTGVNNGRGFDVHASVNKFLLRENNPILQSFNVPDNLQFGDQLSLNKSKAIEQVITHKKILKEVLQKHLGLEVDPNKPLFSLVARIADQKNVPVLIRNVKFIIENGGQVVIGGPEGKDAGSRPAVREIQELHEELQANPATRDQFVYLIKMIPPYEVTLIMGGSDFHVIPSKYEPCGLTDIESQWLGAVNVVSKVGGLTKGCAILGYRPIQGTSEVMSLRNELIYAINLYRGDIPKDHRTYLGRVLDGLKQNFDWGENISKYLIRGKILTLNQWIMKMDGNLQSQQVTDQVYELVAGFVVNKILNSSQRVPLGYKEEFLENLKYKPPFMMSKLEQMILRQSLPH
jgi:glycogen synthase